jgi:hypothetical protein
MAPHVAVNLSFAQYIHGLVGTTRPLETHLFCANDTTRLLVMEPGYFYLVELYSTVSYVNIVVEPAPAKALSLYLPGQMNRTEPNRTEPNRTEPNRTEPNRTEP